MAWLIGLAVLVVLIWAFRSSAKTGSDEPPTVDDYAAPRIRSTSATQSKTRTYAQIQKNGQYVDISSPEVEALFAPYRERLKVLKKAAARSERLADKLQETGKIDDAAVVETTAAWMDSKGTLANAESTFDALFFNSETSSEKYWKIVDGLSEAEGGLDETLSIIKELQAEIETGDFEPSPVYKPKKKPKGAKPTIRIRYKDAQGNVTQREIAILDLKLRKDGETEMSAWCFDANYERTFLLSRVLTAVDIERDVPVADFNPYRLGAP